MVPKVIMSFLLKMIKFKNGSLTLLSFTMSLPISYWFNILIGESNPKHLMIPILLMAIGTIMFVLICLMDLWTGLSVARYNSIKRFGNINKNYVQSHKLYRTLWKLLGVILLSFLLTVTSLMIEIMELSWIYVVSISFQGTVWLLACGFEIHSIGENHLKRYGYKPRFFKFWDNILNIFEKKVADKIESSFDNILPDDEIVEQENKDKDA